MVIPDDKPVKFDYMLKEKGNSWRIINIIANGVSDLALKDPNTPLYYRGKALMP